MVRQYERFADVLIIAGLLVTTVLAVYMIASDGLY